MILINDSIGFTLLERVSIAILKHPCEYINSSYNVIIITVLIREEILCIKSSKDWGET